MRELVLVNVYQCTKFEAYTVVEMFNVKNIVT